MSERSDRYLDPNNGDKLPYLHYTLDSPLVRYRPVFTVVNEILDRLDVLEKDQTHYVQACDVTAKRQARNEVIDLIVSALKPFTKGPAFIPLVESFREPTVVSGQHIPGEKPSPALCPICNREYGTYIRIICAGCFDIYKDDRDPFIISALVKAKREGWDEALDAVKREVGEDVICSKGGLSVGIVLGLLRDKGPE